MSEFTILQVSKTISSEIDLSKCQKETLYEIELSIKKINNLLENEKTREKIVKDELNTINNFNENNLLEYLALIEKNIKKLSLFLEILENKKNLFLFDAKNYFKSIEDINLHKLTSLI